MILNYRGRDSVVKVSWFDVIIVFKRFVILIKVFRVLDVVVVGVCVVCKFVFKSKARLRSGFVGSKVGEGCVHAVNAVFAFIIRIVRGVSAASFNVACRDKNACIVGGVLGVTEHVDGLTCFIN